MPSRARSRQRRSASVSTATRSLIPSTRTTARASARTASACSTEATSRIFTVGMRVEAGGTRVWFDVDGPALVPDGPQMRERPTVVLLHGGPGSFDHSYFKPDFAQLAASAQVVYLDLAGHGRTDWGDPDEWTFEGAADTVRDFCDAVGVARPIVLGHSLGGFVALVYAIRHPEHPGGLVLQSTFARYDLGRIVE